MCGRFAVIQSQDELAELFEVDRVGEGIPGPSYNIAPTERIAIVLESVKEGREGRRLESARWGLVPSFARDPSAGARRINARVETIATTPAFRGAFARRRAIVPATGYYEWHVGPDGKRPWFLHPADDAVLAFAGLYEWWRDPATGAWLLSASIVTRPATGELAGLHDRMPLLLGSDVWADWLDPRSSVSEELLGHALEQGSCIADGFELRPVSPAVGPTRGKADDPSLLARVG